MMMRMILGPPIGPTRKSGSERLERRAGLMAQKAIPSKTAIMMRAESTLGYTTISGIVPEDLKRSG